MLFHFPNCLVETAAKSIQIKIAIMITVLDIREWKRAKSSQEMLLLEII